MKHYTGILSPDIYTTFKVDSLFYIVDREDEFKIMNRKSYDR